MRFGPAWRWVSVLAGPLLGCGGVVVPEEPAVVEAPRQPILVNAAAGREAPRPEPWRVPVPALDAEPSIRVLLLQTDAAVTLSGGGLLVQGAEGAATATVSLDGGVLATDDPRCAGTTCRFDAPGGVTVDGHGTHPGTIELRADGELASVIVELPLERYLERVVSNEVPARWGVESKKAQAVAARSYALVRLLRGADRPWHVVSTPDDQVYRAWASATAIEAVASTRGEVLVEDGILIEGFFHSTCGGHTEDPAAVWPEAGPWHWATECSTCAAAPRYRWQAQLENDVLVAALREGPFAVDGIDDEVLEGALDLEVEARSPSGRVDRVALGGGEDTSVSLSAVQLRRAVGTSKLRSTWFDVERRDGRLHFEGRGNGHGVGLCQWGAHGLVAEGHDYRQVLEHYYRGTELRTLYE